jgi:energy-coupling factor transporter ATP-binding protein EcfA2
MRSHRKKNRFVGHVRAPYRKGTLHLHRVEDFDSIVITFLVSTARTGLNIGETGQRTETFASDAEIVHMSLEEQIVEWSATRPPWQRLILRRVATGHLLSEKDYDDLLESCLAPTEIGNADFGIEHLPQVKAGDPAVTLVSVGQPEHVNALTSDKALTFQQTGLTIVYGDNASGKSGYARLLKRVARARHQEDILSDVFRDTAFAKPRAALGVKVGDKETVLIWPESTLPELQRILFYDEQCGSAYIATESEFLYRPSVLFVMDGLIEACVAVRNRIDITLEQNSRSAKPMPMVNEDLKDTAVGKFLVQLSGKSSVQLMDDLINEFDISPETIEELKDQEARLRTADTSKETQKLTRQAVKLESLRDHFGRLQGALGDEALAAIQTERGQLEALDQATNLLAKSFDSEPLRGVGTSPWRELWESARRFSAQHAYPGEPFPVIGEGAVCVLCQQSMESKAKERFSRFELFVQDDTQVRLQEARSAWAARVAGLAGLRIIPEDTETNLTDLQPDHPELILESRVQLAKYDGAHAGVVDVISGTLDLPRFGLVQDQMKSKLETAAAEARAAAEGLSDTEKIKERLAIIINRRKELELLQELKNQREVAIAEITRLKDRELLETAKNAAATGPITKKILELSEANITEVVRDTFTRETDRLHLERVTITKTRGDRGMLLHQPKLVGARQTVALPRVFSEGEQTALGLAAFFTEAQLDASKSALILDDPVSSLDHIRRGYVAVRLAALAESRQVVVFTHDVSFVAELKREARGIGVSVAERSVTRGFGGEKKPGLCSSKHPWKAKDVAERLGELRRELARIKKDHNSWDGETYEKAVANWAGDLSETWERIFNQEIVGQVLVEGGLEVRPTMAKILVRFTEVDDREFQASYSRVSQWAKRHDKSALVNYVSPDISSLEKELKLVEEWFLRVKQYKA